MQRIPEQELMDEAGQVLAYAQADFSASDAAMVERLAQLCADDPGTALLDLGCGPGNISLLLAGRWPAAKVLGLDGAPRMLAVARERLAGAPPEMAACLRFEQALLPLTAAGELEAHFSAVVCNSLLHHLHDPAVLWQTVAQLGAPGAFVYVQDLRRPDNAEAVEALVSAKMARAPEALRSDYRASLHAAFTVVEVEQQLERAAQEHGCLAALQVAPRQDRYLEVWGRLV